MSEVSKYIVILGLQQGLFPHYATSDSFLIIAFSLCSVVLSLYQDTQLSESRVLHTLGFSKAPETAFEMSQDAHKPRGSGLW